MTSVSSINKSIASLDNQNSDLTGKYPDVSQMEELLSLLVKSSTNSIAFNGTQISNLMSLLRKVLQHWTQELQQQKQQTECSEFLLQLSRLCVISLQSFNTSDGNMEKYFKILSYPLIQCYKMGERDILLTFLENSCDAMLIFKNKTNIFSCESFYSCIGNLLQSLAQFSSKFKSNKEQNIDLISRCGRCFLIILENNFIELLKEHFPIEQFKKLIPYVLESVLQYVEYSNILSVTANIELSLSNEYIHQFVISTYIKELSHLNLSRLFDTVSRHLIQLKKIASTPNTTSTITIISKNNSNNDSLLFEKVLKGFVNGIGEVVNVSTSTSSMEVQLQVAVKIFSLSTATATARMSLVFATVRLASRLLHMLLPLQFICDKNTNTSSSIMSIIQSIRINLGLIPAPVSVVSHNITPCDSSSFSSPPSSEYLSLCNEFTDMFQTWTTCDNININNTPVTTTNHKNDTCSDINTAGAGAAVVPVSTQLPTDVLYEGILSLVSLIASRSMNCGLYTPVITMLLSADIGEKNFGDEIIKALPPALVIPSSTSTSMHAVQLDNIKYQLQSLLIKEVVKKINSDTSSCSSSSSSSQVPLDPIVLWENIMTVTSSLNVTMTMNVNVDIATATSRCIIDINEVSELFLLYHRVVSQKESPGDGNCNGGSGGGILRDVTHTNMDNVITRLTCICQHITTQNNNIVANASNNNNTNNTANNVSGNENKDIDQENLNPNTTAGRNTFSIKTKKKQNEVIQSKKKNNTTSSSTSDDDVIINQQTTSRLLELASLFRVWVLHTECRLWSSHSKEYPLSESGSGSTSVTFAVEGLHHSALQVLRQIKIQLSNNITSVAIDSNENKAQCMVHRVCRCVNVNVFPISIAEDVRTLYDQLSFTGNLSDQMKLCKECDDISSILLHTENIWFNNDSEFNRITNEITSLFSLQILTNNLQSQYKLFKPTHISEDYSLVFQFIDKLSRFQLHDFEGELGSDGSNSSRSNSSDDSSRSRSTMEELNDFSRCIIGRGAGAVSKGKTGPSVSSTTNPNTTTNVSVSSAVRAWCSVAYARLLFVLYLDVSSAFYWCRLAITISNPTTTATLPLPSPNTQTVQRQYVLVRLESFLLLADLLDHCGSPDSALGYLAEAKTMALTITGTGTMMASTRENRRRGVTDTLSGLVCLHELRILCRVGSSRVETVYDTIAQLTPSNCSSNCSGKNNKMIESHNLISMIQSASVILRKHYSPTSSSTSTLTLKLIRDKEMKEREVLPMFRFLSVIWTDMDFGNITDEDKDICKVNCGFHCYLPHSLRNEIKSFLDPSHVDSPSFSSEDSDHALESGLNLLATMQGISNSNDICDCNGISNGFRVEASFDILRAVRRRTAVLCSTINPITTATTTGNMTISGNRNAMSSTLLQFILGASSIGSSVEAVLHGRGRGANGSTALESASTLIRRACANDSSAVSHMGDILTSLLGQLSGFTAPADSNGSAPGSGAICFLALDKPANKLIIGRYDAAAALLGEGNGTDKRTGNGTGTGTGRSLVRVLPITSDLMDILEHWDPNSTLQPTDTSSSKSSSTTASQLSNQVKKDWWKKRETADSDLDVLLQRLQTQLGPWRCLLQPCTDSTLPRDSSSGDGGGLDAMGLTASVRRVLEVCVQELITKTHGIKTASSSSQKSSSNTKSPPINTNEAATTTAMTVLINWMQYLLLQHQHQHESLSSSPSRYLTTEEIKFAMKTVLMEFSANIDETSKSSLKMSVIEDQQWAKDTTNAIYEVFYHSAIKKSTTCDESKSTVASNNTDMGNIAVVTNNTVVSSAAPSLSEKELTAMKVVTLRDLLKEAGLSTVGRKNELVDRLLEHTTTTTTPTSASSTKTTARQDMSATTNKLESANIKQNESEGSGSNHIDIESGGGERGGGGGGGPHLVLLLCESLQSLPWECIPLLRARRTSRVPSLALLLSQQQHLAQEQGQQPGDIIIPISNQEKEEVVTDDIIPLMEVTTRTSASSSTSSSTSTSNARESKESTDCASSSLKPHSYRSLSVRRCWYALDPEANLPATREAMVSFVEPYVDKWRWRGFVGEIPTMNTVSDCHNSSDLFIYCGHGAGEKICDYQRMRKCHYPASFLWGCSSGKLKSYGVHDPQGPVLNYLLGGAPWVIGNLWDVTDKDIDRLSISCMHAVLTSTVQDECSPAYDIEGNLILGQ
eukprot:gene4052-8059_t